MTLAALEALSARLDEVPASHWDGDKLADAMNAGAFAVATSSLQVRLSPVLPSQRFPLPSPFPSPPSCCYRHRCPPLTSLTSCVATGALPETQPHKRASTDPPLLPVRAVLLGAAVHAAAYRTPLFCDPLNFRALACQTELARRAAPSADDLAGDARVSAGICKAACDVIARLSRSSANQARVGVFGCALLTSVLKAFRDDAAVVEAVFRAMSNTASSNGSL